MPKVIPKGRDREIYKMWLELQSLAKVGVIMGLTKGRIGQIVREQRLINS